MWRWWLVVTSVALSLCCGAQTPARDTTRIELIRANDLRFDKRFGVDAQRLIGNVQLRHKGAIMYCDSAWLYQTQNRLEAFGRVRINQGDTINLYGDRIDYNGDTRMALVRDNIRLLDKDMTLTTDVLDYDMRSSTGVYYNGGRLASKANNNVLVSRRGYYYAESDLFYFRDSVVLTHPDYTMYTDTLRYNTVTEVAYFLGPTRIVSDENTIYCENGWYDTENDKASFEENAVITRREYTLTGDSLYYDRVAGYGEAFDRVTLGDSINRYEIRGQYGRYLEKQGRSFVTGRATLVQDADGDTLFMHGDTLLAVQDTVAGNSIYAWNNVRIFKSDLQGDADSLAYHQSDSLLTLFGDPVMWSDENQITGDTLRLLTFEGVMYELRIPSDALIISEVDSANYNQIKGRSLLGKFKENQLVRIDIFGNGQSIYYAVEESKEDSTSTIIGINKAECSDITIYVANNEIKRIAFKTQPAATFFPPEDFPNDQKKLKGFEWLDRLRPRKPDDIYLTPPVGRPLQSGPEENATLPKPESSVLKKP